MTLAILKTVAWGTYYRMKDRVKDRVLKILQPKEEPRLKRRLRIVP